MTFLFTDIEGSTRRWEVHGSAMAECVSRHDELLHRAVEEHDGTVVKTTGDGVMAVFTSAAQALAAAVAGQRAIEHHDWSPIPQIRVRMGLHTGWCEPTGDDYFSPVVNRAARIADAGHGGQILLSAATTTVIGHSEVEIVGRGEARLKDLAEPVELFQVLAPELNCEQLTLRTLSTELGDLPIRRTTFVGRSKEVEQTIRALETHRLVTLLGPGGVGKTRLAVQVAGEVSQQFEAGVRFLDLAEVQETENVATAVLDQLHRRSPSVTRASTVADPTDGIIGYLSGTEILLLADNCEHVTQTASVLLDAILRHCPQCRVLATGRERLAVSGEQVIRIGPFPTSATPQPDNAAIQLFHERAAAGGAPPLEPDTLPLVAEICEMVDGLPLGIELAAARSLHLPLASLAQRLRSAPHHILRGDDPTQPDRHRTVEGLLRWSIDLLGDREQRLLRRLAMFVGQVSLDAIESLCADDDLPADRVVDLLTALVDQSLVVFDEALGQYRLLNVVRSFALDQFDASSLAEWRERHAAWCADSLQRADREETDGALELFMAAHAPDVHVALAWAIDAKRADLACSLAGASWRWYEITGRARDGLELLQRALVTGEANETFERATAMSGAGSLAMVLGDVELAREYQRQATAAFERCGAEAEAASARTGLAMALMLAGDAGAAAEAEQALAMAEQVHDQRRTAHASAALGLIAAREGRQDDARGHYLDALSRSRLGGRRRDAASILSNLGNLSQDRNEYREASRFYDGALQLYREIGDHRGAGLILNNLSIIAQARENPERAAELAQEAIAEFNAVRDRQGAAAAHHNLANLAMEAGRHDEAIVFYRQAIEGFRDARDPRGVVMALASAGDAARRSGRTSLAWDLELDRALVMHRLGLRDATRRAILGLSSTAGHYGDHQLAAALHRAAESLLADEVKRVIEQARGAELGEHDAPSPESMPGFIDRSARLNELTERERELLVEVGNGGTNSEIAEVLFISRRTVDAHLSHIRTKLGVTDRSKLIVLAREHLCELAREDR